MNGKDEVVRTLRAEDNEAMQGIVRLLTEFDERTGRFRRFKDPETHYCRKAVCSADPGLLTFRVADLGGFVYQVVAEMVNGVDDGDLPIEASQRLVTVWVHEDGIRAERDLFSGDSKHHFRPSNTCSTRGFCS